MPKNIVLCSDGTGNSGAKLNGTNVWRLFEALDRSPPPEGERGQIAFYDDGVGTSTFKPLRIIGGAFGWGLTRNLEQLYGFLIRHFDPGDDIYLIGFSRGAFTVRVLANILYYCGLPSRNNLSPPQIDQLAEEAIAAYKQRARGDRTQKWPHEFRERLKSAGGYSDVPIKAIGVWDTVDAVGLPFDELTHLFSWLMPLRFDEVLPPGSCDPTREDDLHPLIERAYHAMALDDERHTFHPVLFQEKYPAGNEQAGQAKPITANGRLQQVWFAGMHSNVGGGYPQDALSLISLNWMLDRLEASARPGERLRFTSLRDDYRRDADAHGRMYDSRMGTGVFYRYRPRPIQDLVRQSGGTKPQIHWTAFDRIARGTDDYLPIGIPLDHDAVDAPAGTAEPLPRRPARFDELAPVQNHVIVGRVQYFLFITFFLLLIGFALWGGRSITNPLPPAACCFEQLLRSVEGVILDLAKWILPQYFESGVETFRERPGSVLFTLLTLFFLWAWTGELDRQVQQIASRAWRVSFPIRPSLAGLPALSGSGRFQQQLARRRARSLLYESRLGTSVGKVSRGIWEWFQWLMMQPVRAVHYLAVKIASKLRTDWVRKKWTWWDWRVMPWIVAILAGYAFFIGVCRIVWTYQLACAVASQQAEPSADFAKHHEVKVDFSTQNPMFDTGVDLIRGETYRVSVKVIEPWKDDVYPASPVGVEKPSWCMYSLIPYRRSTGQPWLMLMGSIGPMNSELIPIGHGTEFRAGRDGRLFLFANDGPADRVYDNNRGGAEITIQLVSIRPRSTAGDSTPAAKLDESKSGKPSTSVGIP